MPAQSFQPQSIGRRQLNFRKGGFQSTVDVIVSAATGETPRAGRIGHLNDAGELVEGLIAAKLPVYIFTDFEDPVTQRSETGMMAGGRFTAFRHVSAAEFSSTEFNGLTSEAIDAPLTSADASGDAADDSGKIRLRAGSEPIVGYLTRNSYKGAEGHDMIDFVPAYIPGTFA